jgi:hypothetical protein
MRSVANARAEPSWRREISISRASEAPPRIRVAHLRFMNAFDDASIFRKRASGRPRRDPADLVATATLWWISTWPSSLSRCNHIPEMVPRSLLSAFGAVIRERKVARPKQFDCEVAVSQILSKDDDKRLLRINAFFDFIGFIKYPVSQKYAASISSIYRIIYIQALSKTNARLKINKNEYDNIILQCSNILTEVLKIKLNTQPFYMADVDYELITLIARFVLSYKGKSSKVTDGPSLRKAYFFLKSGGYGRKYQQYELSDAWSTLKTVAAFHYVNLRHSRMLSFRPHDKDFEHRVSGVLNDYSRLTRFFAESLWVQNRLLEILSPRPFQGATLPSFPPIILAQPLTVELPDKRMGEIMPKYSAPY